MLLLAKMELFKLKIEKRNKLYYGKYPYRATLKVVGSSYTYYSKNYDDFCARMQRHKNDVNKSQNYHVKDGHEYWVKFLDTINYLKIKEYFKWRETNADYVTIRVEGDKISVFCCDLNLLTTLETINPQVTYTKVIPLKNDTLYFKKTPKFKYRTFFKSKRITTEFGQNVLDFAKRYNTSTEIKLSSSIVKFIKERNINRYTYLHGSYFVDYNNESVKSLVYMFFGDMLGKTYYLEKEP